MLGVRRKNGSQQRMLQPFGLEPVFSKRIGRGMTTFYQRDLVIEAAAKALANRREKQRPEPPTATRFVPTGLAMEAMSRIESKLDRLLAIWGEQK